MTKTKRKLLAGVSAFGADRRGNSIIVFALMLPVGLAALAMVADMGLWRQNARAQQLDTDAAAVAGAHELFYSEELSALTVAAKGLLKENGLDLNVVSVDVYSPPVTGAYIGKEGVQVKMTRPQKRFFSGIFLKEDPVLETVSTALKVEGTGPICILALDPVTPASLDLTGTATVDVEQCGVQANSTAVDALEVGGSSSLTAGCVFSTGGIISNNQIFLSLCSQTKTGQKALKDPYSSLEPPAGIASLPCEKPKKLGNKGISMASGRYCSDVVANNLVELEAGGTFIFDAADFQMKSANSIVSGTDVTLIFVNNGTIDMSNAGQLNMTAKTTGDFAGVLMYSDPRTTTEGAVVKITGNADSSVTGAFYFPKQDVDYTGGTTTKSGCTQLIARRISFSGNSAFNGEHCADAGAKLIERAPGVVLASG